MVQQIEKLKQRYDFDRSLAELVAFRLLAHNRRLNLKRRKQYASSITPIIRDRINPDLVRIIDSQLVYPKSSASGRLKQKVYIRETKIQRTLRSIVSKYIGHTERKARRDLVDQSMSFIEDQLDSLDWKDFRG